MTGLAHGTHGVKTVPSTARVQNKQSYVIDLQGNVSANLDILATNVNSFVLQERMDTIATKAVNAKTMQLVPDTMARVTVPGEAGQGCSVITHALGDSSG